MSDNSYRNLQLLTSGFINPGTATVIDIGYDPSYEIFKIFLFDCAIDFHFHTSRVLLTMSADRRQFYANLENLDFFSTAFLLSQYHGPNYFQDHFSSDITLYINQNIIDNAHPIYMMARSLYNDQAGNLFSYDCGGFYAPTPGTIVSLAGFVTVTLDAGTFTSGRYVSYGLSARGAAQVVTSTTGG